MLLKFKQLVLFLKASQTFTELNNGILVPKPNQDMFGSLKSTKAVLDPKASSSFCYMNSFGSETRPSDSGS